MAGRALVVRRGEPRVMRTPYGDVLAFVAGEADTQGGFSLHERVAPPASRSTPHAHHAFIEAFYVVDGALSVTVEGETIAASAGTFVLVPKGATHAWANDGPTDARVLVIFAPSQTRAYFEELDALTAGIKDGNASAQEFAALTKKYHQD